jgi:hypothetical protein
MVIVSGFDPWDFLAASGEFMLGYARVVIFFYPTNLYLANLALDQLNGSIDANIVSGLKSVKSVKIVRSSSQPTSTN